MEPALPLVVELIVAKPHATVVGFRGFDSIVGVCAFFTSE
jgi:hypothetical protein